MKKKSLPKVGLLNLGCPRNLVDTENTIGRLSLQGYPVVDIEQAEVAILNTCAFINDAKRESIAAILDLIELKKQGRLRKLIVYGCLVERYKDALRRQFPEVDAFIGRVSLNHGLKRFAITPRHFVYLKICEGCINNCSFCVIPKIKGNFSSLDPEAILKRVELFNKEGVSEINIIGQDITGYGRDLGPATNLSGLLKQIIPKLDNIGWLRLLYLNPNRLDDELLDLVRDSKKICKYLDLPIQHINNRILALMNRQTKRSWILKLIDRARKKIPEVSLRTSIIVGFPSETDKEFKELLSFLKAVRFERLGAFVYSREEGTAAYNLAGQIPEKIKQERFKAVMSLQQGVSQDNNKRLLGRIIEVLIEEKENGFYLGRSQYDAPEVDGLVYVKTRNKLKPGDFAKVKIYDTLEYDLVAEVIS